MLKAFTDGIKEAINTSKINEEYPNTIISVLTNFLDDYKRNSIHLTDPVFESLILDVIASYVEIQVASQNNKEKLTALLEYIPSEPEPEPETDLKNAKDWESRKV